jgi:hypothetical protein
LSGKIFTAYPLNTIAPDKNSIFFYQEDNEEVDEEQMAQDEAILNAGNKVIVLKKDFFLICLCSILLFH